MLPIALGLRYLGHLGGGAAALGKTAAGALLGGVEEVVANGRRRYPHPDAAKTRTQMRGAS